MVQQKGPPGGGYVLCPSVWILKPVVLRIEEEAMSLLVFYNCICAFLCHCRSFNPSLCHLSSFLLPYATVSRPYCLLELTLTGPHQRNRQIQSGKGFIGSFDLHEWSKWSQITDPDPNGMHPLWLKQHIMKETVHTIESHAWRRKWSIVHAHTNQPWTTNTKDAPSCLKLLLCIQ